MSHRAPCYSTIHELAVCLQRVGPKAHRNSRPVGMRGRLRPEPGRTSPLWELERVSGHGAYRCSPFTKSWASLVSSTHEGFASATASHSFITLPGPGSKRSPTPDAARVSTRSFGSLTTRFPRTLIANSFPFTLSPFEPNFLPGSLLLAA